MSIRTVKLLGRVFVVGEIETKTGLRIGDSQATMTIGGVDLPVIRNRRTNEPYIPGSSLKGKMRSLSEKFFQAPLNFQVHKGDERTGKGRVEIHTAQSPQDYADQKYGWVSKVFGTTGDAGDFITAPSRLVVRDVMLAEASRDALYNLKTDLPYTEVKWEAAIDRVTSAATPRQIERVPAGAVFGPMEMVFSYFLKGDEQFLGNLLTSMELLEDDYLGGHGSRGSGKIEFHGLRVYIRKGTGYQQIEDPRFSSRDGLALPQLVGLKTELLQWVTDQMKEE